MALYFFTQHNIVSLADRMADDYSFISDPEIRNAKIASAAASVKLHSDRIAAEQHQHDNIDYRYVGLGNDIVIIKETTPSQPIIIGNTISANCSAAETKAANEEAKRVAAEAAAAAAVASEAAKEVQRAAAEATAAHELAEKNRIEAAALAAAAVAAAQLTAQQQAAAAQLTAQQQAAAAQLTAQQQAAANAAQQAQQLLAQESAAKAAAERKAQTEEKDKLTAQALAAQKEGERLVAEGKAQQEEAARKYAESQIGAATAAAAQSETEKKQALRDKADAEHNEQIAKKARKVAEQRATVLSAENMEYVKALIGSHTVIKSLRLQVNGKLRDMQLIADARAKEVALLKQIAKWNLQPNWKQIPQGEIKDSIKESATLVPVVQGNAVHLAALQRAALDAGVIAVEAEYKELVRELQLKDATILYGIPNPKRDEIVRYVSDMIDELRRIVATDLPPVGVVIPNLLDQLKAGIRSLKDDHDNIQRQVAAAHTAAIAQVSKERDTALAAKNAYDAEEKRLQTEIQKQLRQIAALQGGDAASQATIRAHLTRIQELEDQILNMPVPKVAAAAAIGNMAAAPPPDAQIDTSALDAEIEALKKQYREAEAKISALKQKLKEAEDENDLLTQLLPDSSAPAPAPAAQPKQLEALVEKDRQLVEAKRQLQTTRDEISGLQTRLGKYSKMEETNLQLQAQVSANEGILRGLRGVNNDLSGKVRQHEEAMRLLEPKIAKLTAMEKTQKELSVQHETDVKELEKVAQENERLQMELTKITKVNERITPKLAALEKQLREKEEELTAQLAGYNGMEDKLHQAARVYPEAIDKIQRAAHQENAAIHFRARNDMRDHFIEQIKLFNDIYISIGNAIRGDVEMNEQIMVNIVGSLNILVNSTISAISKVYTIPLPLVKDDMEYIISVITEYVHIMSLLLHIKPNKVIPTVTYTNTENIDMDTFLDQCGRYGFMAGVMMSIFANVKFNTSLLINRSSVPYLMKYAIHAHTLDNNMLSRAINNLTGDAKLPDSNAHLSTADITAIQQLTTKITKDNMEAKQPAYIPIPVDDTDGYSISWFSKLYSGMMQAYVNILKKETGPVDAEGALNSKYTRETYLEDPVIEYEGRPIDVNIIGRGEKRIMGGTVGGAMDQEVGVIIIAVIIVLTILTLFFLIRLGYSFWVGEGSCNVGDGGDDANDSSLRSRVGDRGISARMIGSCNELVYS